jgi:hypothetical protein
MHATRDGAAALAPDRSARNLPTPVRAGERSVPHDETSSAGLETLVGYSLMRLRHQERRSCNWTTLESLCGPTGLDQLLWDILPVCPGSRPGSARLYYSALGHA